MIRRPPRSTLDRSSAASHVYKRQTGPDTLPGERDDAAEAVVRLVSVGNGTQDLVRYRNDIGRTDQR